MAEQSKNLITFQFHSQYIVFLFLKNYNILNYSLTFFDCKHKVYYLVF